MKRAKRVLAILLSVMMLTTLIPMSVFAAETTEAVEVPDEVYDGTEDLIENAEESTDVSDDTDLENEVSDLEDSAEEAVEAPDEVFVSDEETSDEIQEDASSYDESAYEAADGEIEEAVEEPAEDLEEEGLMAASGKQKDAEAEDFANAVDISLYESVLVEFSENENFPVFKFTPEEDGTYVFYSMNNVDSDPKAYLYDSEYNEITYEDDNSARNFYLEYDLTAGMTYYYEAGLFLYEGDEKTGSYVVKLSREYSVTYDANGGSLSSSEQRDSTWDYVLAGEPMIPEYQGYLEGKAFVGWYAEDPDCKDENRVISGEYIPNGDVTLYAKYVDGIAVTLNAGEDGYFGYGDNDTYIREKTVFVAEGETIDLSVFTPHFEDDSDFKTWTYENGESIEDINHFSTDTAITLFAKKKGMCKVTFDAGQGYFKDTGESTYIKEVFDGSQYYYYGDIPSDPKANDLHYVFEQWYRDKACTEPIDKYAIQEMVIKEDTTLYAGYVPAHVVTIEAGDHGYITEDGNDETHLTEYSFSLAEGDSVDLEYPSECGFSLFGDDNYSVYGFHYKDTGEKVEEPGYFTTDRDLTLVVNWRGYFIISFDPGDGSMDKETPKEPSNYYWYEGDDPFDAPPIAYSFVEGEVFAGWYKDPKLTERMDFTNYCPTKNETFYAKYKQGVKVTLKAGEYGYFNGEQGNTKIETYVSEEAPLDLEGIYISSNSVEVYLDGWVYENRPDTKVENEEEFWSDTPQTLVVNWKKNYKVTLDPAGGTINGKSDPVTKYVKPGNSCYLGEEVESSEPGKIFAGWKTGSKIYKLYDYYRPTGDVTLTADYSEVWTVTVKAGETDDCFFEIWDDEGNETEVSEITIEFPKGDSIGRYLRRYSDPYSKNPDKVFMDAYLINGQEYDEYHYYDYVPKKDGEILVALYREKFLVTVYANGGFFDKDGEEKPTDTFKVVSGQKIIVLDELDEGPQTRDENLRFTGEFFYDSAMTKPVGNRLRVTKNVEIYAGWTEQVKVTWNAGPGGTFEDGETEWTEKVDKNSVFARIKGNIGRPTANDESLAFEGWYTDLDLKNPATNTLTIDRDMDFYANYGDSYPVTFDAGNGTINGKQQWTVRVLKDSRGIPNPDEPISPDPDKKFSHWIDAETGYPVSLEYELVQGSMTLNAVYDDIYTVVFKSGDGHWYDEKPNGERSYPCVVGSMFYPYEYEDPYTNDNRSFAGWSTVQGDITHVLPEKALDSEYTNKTGTIILYAVYEDPVTITFISGEDGLFRGADTVYKDTFTKNSMIRPEYLPVEKEGSNKVFDRWYIEEDGQRKPVDLDTLRADKDMTLYAGYTEGYRVKFETFGEGAVRFEDRWDDWDYKEELLVRKGESISVRYPYCNSLAGNAEFYLDSAFSNESKISNIFDYCPEEDVTIYVKIGNDVEVTFIADSELGEGYIDSNKKTARSKYSPGHDFEYFSEDHYVETDDPKSVFTGWYEDRACTKEVKDSRIINEDLTVYAGYTKAVEVVFHAEGGFFTKDQFDGNESGEYSDKLVRYWKPGSGHWLEDMDPSNDEDNVFFDKWTTAQGEQADRDDYYTVPVGTDRVDLYATWKKLFKVYYHGCGGLVYGEVVDYESFEEGKDITFPTPVHENSEMVFDGWYTAASGGEKVTSLNITKETDLYAHYKKASFTVTLDANGGYFDDDESKTTLTAGSDGEKSLADLFRDSISNVAKTGPNFWSYLKGWKTSTGTELTPANVENYIPKKNETITAQWDETVKVLFYANGGSLKANDSQIWMTYIVENQPLEYYDSMYHPYSSMSIQKLFSGELVEAPAGSEFIGWFTAATGGEQVQKDYEPTASITQHTIKQILYL